MATSIAKSIIAIAVCTVMTGFLYSSLSSSFCGTCPKRSFRVFGSSLRIVEWWSHSRSTTWFCVGETHIDVPLPVSAAVTGSVAVMLLLARFGSGSLRLVKLRSIAVAAGILAAVLFLTVGGMAWWLGSAPAYWSHYETPLLATAMTIGNSALGVGLLCFLCFEFARIVQKRQTKYL